MLTDNQILENLDRHRNQTSVSAQQYFRLLQTQLADQLVGKRRLLSWSNFVGHLDKGL